VGVCMKKVVLMTMVIDIAYRNTNENSIINRKALPQHCLESMSTMSTLDQLVKKKHFGSFGYSHYNVSSCDEADFDVVIQQTLFGWFEKPMNRYVTYVSIDEMVKLSQRHFGAKIVLLQTVPIMKNVLIYRPR